MFADLFSHLRVFRFAGVYTKYVSSDSQPFAQIDKSGELKERRRQRQNILHVQHVFWYITLPPLHDHNAGFISERGFAGFPQFGKKMPHKIYVATSNGAQNNRPKDKYYFLEITHSKTSPTTTLI